MNLCTGHQTTIDPNSHCQAVVCAAACGTCQPIPQLPAHSGDLASMMILASVAGWALRRSYNTFHKEGDRK